MESRCVLRKIDKTIWSICHSPPAAELATEKGHDFGTRNLSGNKMKVSITRKYLSICIRTCFWGFKKCLLMPVQPESNLKFSFNLLFCVLCDEHGIEFYITYI